MRKNDEFGKISCAFHVICGACVNDDGDDDDDDDKNIWRWLISPKVLQISNTCERR
jgi:hypothetical protein